MAGLPPGVNPPGARQSPPATWAPSMAAGGQAGELGDVGDVGDQAAG
jgi:hypothetical protein